MSPIMPSASEIQRVMECAASAQLPKVQSTSDAAARGSAIHAYLERLVKGEPEDIAVQSVPEQYRLACLDIDMTPFWAQQYSQLQSEVSIAVNVNTTLARVLGSNRAYSTVTPEEFYGTADYIGRTQDGILVVGDFKTGVANVAHPKDNWQLKTLAYALSQLHGEGEVEVAIVKTEGETRILVHRFNAMDLAVIGSELKSLHSRLQTTANSYREGKHCDYCPAYKFCPAKITLLRELAAAPVVSSEQLAGELKGEDAKKAYRRYKAIKAALQKVEAELRMLTDREPIDLGDGFFYGPTKQTREELDGKTVFETLASIYGADVAKSAVEFATSKTAIDRAIAPHCEKGTRAKAVRSVIDTVANYGGVTITEKVITKEYRNDEE